MEMNGSANNAISSQSEALKQAKLASLQQVEDEQRKI